MEKKEESIKQEEMKHLTSLMDLSECMMFVAKQNPGIEVLYANKKFYSMLQYTPDEFAEHFQKYFIEVILSEEKQRIKSLIARQSAAGGMLKLEFRVVKKDGSVRWLSMMAEAVTVDNEALYYCSCLDITQQKRTLEDVYDAKKEVELMTNSVPGGVVKIRMNDFALLYANDGFYRLAGYSRTEYMTLFGNKCNMVIFPDDSDMVKRLVRSAVENRGALGFEYRIIAKNGEVRWSYINGCRVDDCDGQAVYLCIIIDITSRKKLEEKFEDDKRRSKYFLETMQITEWTYKLYEQHVYQSGYLDNGEPLLFDSALIYKMLHPDDVGAFLQEIEVRKKELGHSKAVYRAKDHAGNYRNAEITMISISTENGELPDIIYGQTRLLNDTSYQLEEERVLINNAVFNKMINIAKEAREKYDDNVTGLMSQDKFIEQVKRKIKKRSQEKHYGILCCDINAFQRINYHYGVSVGDEILVHLGKLLKETLAVDELCTRAHGDYFVAFFEYEEHDVLVKKISQILRNQSDWEQEQSYSTHGTTCGVYLLDQTEQDIEPMLEKADLARRSIKGTKGSHYAVYTEELQKSRFWEEEVIRDIGKAMQNHSIEIFYLPRIEGDKENVVGCKSIPRVQMKDGNYLSLEDLRRYLDRSKAVQQLVFYVLSNVCGNISAWKANGKKILPVSVDITAGQLCMQGAVEKLDDIVKSNKLSPQDIIFEIQEPEFAQITVRFREALNDLSRRGYSIIISRFASDHTAIHALRNLPVSGIKFHGEFFQQSILDSKEKIVFSKIVEMVQEIGLSVACGGIQTQLQEEFARSIGCEILEGEIYYGAVSNDIYEKCFLENE